MSDNELRQRVIDLKLTVGLHVTEIVAYLSRRDIALNERQVWSILMESLSNYGSANTLSNRVGQIGD